MVEFGAAVALGASFSMIFVLRWIRAAMAQLCLAHGTRPTHLDTAARVLLAQLFLIVLTWQFVAIIVLGSRQLCQDWPEIHDALAWAWMTIVPPVLSDDFRCQDFPSLPALPSPTTLEEGGLRNTMMFDMTATSLTCTGAQDQLWKVLAFCSVMATAAASAVLLGTCHILCGTCTSLAEAIVHEFVRSGMAVPCTPHLGSSGTSAWSAPTATHSRLSSSTFLPLRAAPVGDDSTSSGTVANLVLSSPSMPPGAAPLGTAPAVATPVDNGRGEAATGCMDSCRCGPGRWEAPDSTALLTFQFISVCEVYVGHRHDYDTHGVV